MKPKILIGVILFSIFLFCFSSGVSKAQDPGNADTVRLANISGEIEDKISMPVFLYNDEELVSVGIPLLVNGYSGWLRFDSVSYVGSRLADPTVLDSRQAYVFGTDIFTRDSLLLSFSVSSGNNLPVGSGKLCDLWFTLWFGGPVLLDSLPVSPQGGLSLTTTGPQSFIPQFSSGLIDIACNYKVGDVNQDDRITLSDVIMHQKFYFYDSPWWDYPIFERAGRFDLNCDRRLDMRDLVHLTDMLVFPPLQACSCGTISPPFNEDPGLPDTVWAESKTLIVGIPSTISVGLINDEPLRGLALALEWDGSAALQFDFNTTGCTERMNNIGWLCNFGNHVNGVNPDTFLFYSWQSNPDEVPSLSPGRDALATVGFVPQSAGTATFRLVSWINGSQSMLVTEDRAAILPALYGGNITVLPYLTGDPNHDGIIDISDVVYLINYLFIGGPAPVPLESGDVTCEGTVDASDVVYLINYLFIGGPPPCNPPTGILIGYHGCKQFQKGTALHTTPPDQDCIEYQYDGEGLLQLKHVNAGFNCCPEIAADITIENNIITIKEIEISGECYCLCLFDVDYEIRNLPPGEYTIIVTEPYVQEGDEILEFTVDLSSSPSGSPCVYRDYWPWGVW
jgi:hypothetical protein